MKIISTLISILIVVSSYSQSSTNIRIIEGQSASGNVCYDLQLNYHGEDVSLASQNYRLFYSSASLKFLEKESNIFLPSTQYTFNVVQHNEGVDASGIGDLAFENNLGFINATIIFNDPRAEGYKLKDNGEWSPVLHFCFEPKESEQKREIILARQGVSASYGRAFVELSSVDKKGVINPLHIDVYKDFIQE